ncbi:hypothetical protein Trydic_g14382 [Trypoxylus dichotomus]
MGATHSDVMGRGTPHVLLIDDLKIWREQDGKRLREDAAGRVALDRFETVEEEDMEFEEVIEQLKNIFTNASHEEQLHHRLSTRTQQKEEDVWIRRYWIASHQHQEGRSNIFPTRTNVTRTRTEDFFRKGRNMGIKKTNEQFRE